MYLCFQLGTVPQLIIQDGTLPRRRRPPSFRILTLSLLPNISWSLVGLCRHWRPCLMEAIRVGREEGDTKGNCFLGPSQIRLFQRAMTQTPASTCSHSSRRSAADGYCQTACPGVPSSSGILPTAWRIGVRGSASGRPRTVA